MQVEIEDCGCEHMNHALVRFVQMMFAKMPSDEIRLRSPAAVSLGSREQSVPAAMLSLRQRSRRNACFNDWKRFCFVLRQIARGDNGRPLSGVDAQQRAQAVLTEGGYTWPGRAQVCKSVVAPPPRRRALTNRPQFNPPPAPS